MNKQRLEVERMVYEIMDILDPSGDNKEFWIKKFSSMSDEVFKKYVTQPFPFFFQTGAFKEPQMNQIRKALNHIKVPLLERIYMPYKYKDSNGRPVKSAECLVLYINDKRMKQLLTKKNHISIDTSVRDMKTGQLTGASKGGRNSDHEVESATISGLDNLLIELSRPRGDAMDDKTILMDTIKVLGQASLKDLPMDPSDSLGKNNLAMMFIGAQMMTNLISDDYVLPYTAKHKNKKGFSRVD